MIAKQTLFLNADRSKVVLEDDPAAKFLLVREGHEIPDPIVEQYGADDLVSTKGKAPKVAEPSQHEAMPDRHPPPLKTGKGKK